MQQKIGKPDETERHTFQSMTWRDLSDETNLTYREKANIGHRMLNVSGRAMPSIWR